jgi:hypothetical protein
VSAAAPSFAYGLADWHHRQGMHGTRCQSQAVKITINSGDSTLVINAGPALIVSTDRVDQIYQPGGDRNLLRDS